MTIEGVEDLDVLVCPSRFLEEHPAIHYRWYFLGYLGLPGTSEAKIFKENAAER